MRKEENGSGDEDKLVHMFPASKNYPLEIDDPLQELLGEFEAYDEEFEESEEFNILEHSTPSQQVFMPFDRVNSLGDKLELLKTKLELLKDSNKRTRYYLRELKNYLPTNRKNS